MNFHESVGCSEKLYAPAIGKTPITIPKNHANKINIHHALFPKSVN